MAASREPRDRQRGNSLLLALIVMSSLATLGSLSVVSVQSSLKATTNDRFQTVAMYAAESGGALAMDVLRAKFDENVAWSGYVTPGNATINPIPVADLPSNGVLPGVAGNVLSPDLNAWFLVEILNNRNDVGFNLVAANDKDAQVIIRATGHGPQGSLAVIEWEVMRVPPVPGAPPPLPPPWTPRPADTVPLVILTWRTVL